MKIIHVVGARPNFMKLAPVYRELANRRGVEQLIVHTGQHYDHSMSSRFFSDLEIPAPDIDLEVGSATHAVQTATIMIHFEPVVLRENPDWTVVYGDVNSTVAAALVAVKLGVLTAHVEAGLRSADRTMPEEINRIVTDRLADLLLTPSRDASQNLRQEGTETRSVALVGNVMIDTLLHSLERAGCLSVGDIVGEGVSDYVLVTLHRPSNVDEPGRLERILSELNRLAESHPVVFPAHPRTRERLNSIGWNVGKEVYLLDPLGYVEMVALMSSAHAILTDSGGIQEESSVLGIPCVTLRPNTERPVTLELGTNLLEEDPARAVDLTLQPRKVSPMKLEGWDGKAAERIADALLNYRRSND